ncbi:very short patch repair endonuclease [Dethiosulfatarculus sandiegensis]|uniref:Very short patch repair endonuclease n=1 Tax=Dethiosulfatarculus sandiegensis TaxID=1429043 RepID=A0A0D2J8R4_9BACT|nr:very short patch repair endonuclease [Dethiosulfatarculus sandiegensis]KIX14534.1 XorII very short patch repair endonuclease [Dethiosulfatarculus sandiegensis]
MADNLTQKQRKLTMQRVKSKDTSPEMKVRRLIHGMGYRYRLHCKELPGKPDLVFPRLKKIIFVHGCFWHRHNGCKYAKIPQTNQDYWLPKLAGNETRDLTNQKKLCDLGWSVLIVWECQTKDTASLTEILREFLEEKING